MKILNYFNVRTFLALAVSQAAAFLAFSFNIRFHLDLLLFGLCIVFPLHFSMQSAFRRRERAIEYFSLFKGGAMALHYSFQIAEDLSAEKKKQGARLLKDATNRLLQQLSFRIPGYGSLQQELDTLFVFIETNRDEISKRNALRMVRYLRDITESSVYLLSLVNHRTMVGPRFYSAFFIIVFPLVQAPIVLYHLDGTVANWLIYVFLAFTSLVLVTLNNFQTIIEYPFDEKGMDAVVVKDFTLDIPS